MGRASGEEAGDITGIQFERETAHRQRFHCRAHGLAKLSCMSRAIPHPSMKKWLRTSIAARAPPCDPARRHSGIAQPRTCAKRPLIGPAHATIVV